MGHFSLSPSGLSGCGVTACRRIYQPSGDLSLGKKKIFCPRSSPSVLPDPCPGFLPRELGLAKGLGGDTGE